MTLFEQFVLFSKENKESKEATTGAAGGAIGHMIQDRIPIYRLINSAKKSRALKEYGKSDLSGGGNAALRVGGTLLPGPGTVVNTVKSAIVGSKFQDLIDEKTDDYMKDHPNAHRSQIRKEIKKALYNDKPLSSIKDKSKKKDK